MEREIVLSSYNNKNQGNNKPENFTTKFTNSIILDSNKEYMIGLNRIIHMSFTWYNVNDRHNNRTIKYSDNNGTSFKTITFEPGVWNYQDFDKRIKSITRKEVSGSYRYPITLTFDETTFRVIIVVATNYELDLRTGNFNDLIGYDKVLLKSGTHIGPKVPNLSQDTDIINIHCDLVGESLVDGEESDIVYSFSSSVLTASYSFTQEPRRVLYSPINKNSISSIRMYVTDGKRRILDLNGADVAYSLILKSV